MGNDQIPGLGLGTPLSRLVRYGLGSATSDLQTFHDALAAADTQWQADQSSGSYGDEISSYQTAAQAAVAALPGEIDSSQSTLLQQASAANDQLQSINSQTTTDAMTGVTSGPASGDAQSAHDLAYQVYAAYQQAASYAPTPVSLPPISSPPAGGTSAGSGGGSAGGATGGTSNVTVNTSSTGKDLAVAGSVAAVAFGGWWLWKNYRF